MSTTRGNIGRAAIASDTVAPAAYVEYEGAFYLKDSIGPDGVPDPISEAVASEIRSIILADLEDNPEAMRVWIAEAERVAAERKRGAA